MTRILFLKPKFYTALALLVDEIPIGLEYIAAAIESRVDHIEISDLGHDKIKPQKIIKQVKPDIVGITCQMAWHNEIKNLTKLVRKTAPNAKILAGGYYPSLFPQLLRIIPELDFIVKGEGEKTFTEICEIGLTDPFRIKGLIFMNEDNLVTSGERPLEEDLDALKFPARHLRKSFYTHMQLPNRFYDTISTARGCVGLCSFCCEPFMFGKPRRRSPENIIKEIDEIIRFHNDQPMQITLADPNFIGRTKKDVQRIELLCELLEERHYDISFSLLTRADIVARQPELIKRMVKNGLNFYELGIEAPDSSILNNTKKGTKIKTIFKAVRTVNQAGGFPVGTLMFGFPGQTEENIRQYFSYAQVLGLREAAFAIATPLVGTGYFREVKEDVFEQDFAKYTYLHPTHWFNPQIDKKTVYFLLGYNFGGFYPSVMIQNEEFYQKLNPTKQQTSLLTYFKFALKALGEFPNYAKVAFARGALTGYFAMKKSEKMNAHKQMETL
ncbi:MAG: B12-binding domain-containing radical SAM protein [Candidatus Hodarchaeales archaeon]|jgi:radical SAM superfamily enzyme YgiQ (UPF0313 family)